MKTQSKPKFTVEQYPLVFSFESSVQGIPVIAVEMLYGEDPNKDLLVGLTVVYANYVLAVISGGVAGCIYSINCTVDEVEVTTTVAVLPTLAPPQENPTVPFTELVTTPPYPGFFEDFADTSFSTVSGTLSTLVVQGWVQDDTSDVDFSVVTGALFTPDPPDLAPDSADFSFGPVAGILKAPPEGDIADDDADVVFAPVSGELKDAPTGLIEDNADFTFGPIGGTLGVP